MLCSDKRHMEGTKVLSIFRLKLKLFDYFRSSVFKKQGVTSKCKHVAFVVWIRYFKLISV